MLHMQQFFYIHQKLSKSYLKRRQEQKIVDTAICGDAKQFCFVRLNAT